jgi:hypothetical protein
MIDEAHVTDEPTDQIDYRAAVYGSVVVAALLGALVLDGASAKAMVLSVATTTFVFWLAHVWADVVSERLQLGHGQRRRSVAHLAREEWPLVQAGFLPLIPLVLAWIGVLSRDVGARLALLIAIGQLAAWGLVFGRRSHASWPMAIVSAAVMAGIGLGVVLLEIAVH